MIDRKTFIFIIAFMLISSMLFSASYTAYSALAGAVSSPDAQPYFGSNAGVSLLSLRDAEFLMGDDTLSIQGSNSMYEIRDSGSINGTNSAKAFTEPSLGMFNVSGSVTAVSFAVTISAVLPEMTFDMQAGHAN